MPLEEIPHGVVGRNVVRLHAAAVPRRRVCGAARPGVAAALDGAEGHLGPPAAGTPGLAGDVPLAIRLAALRRAGVALHPALDARGHRDERAGPRDLPRA